MIRDPATLLKLLGLSTVMRQLLEENAYKNPDLNSLPLQTALLIKKQIEDEGFVVHCDFKNDPKNPKQCKVTVTISEPKANMTPKEIQEYEDGFLNKRFERYRLLS